MAQQQERRGAPAEAREAEARQAQPGSVAVVTGQQAGLFGGPLFTLLKALTAVTLAERVHREHGVPAAAVFWIDAEDHDWDEVRACLVLDESLTLRTVAVPPHAAPPLSRVADVRLDDSIIATLDELERTLPATEFRSGVMDALRVSYTPGTGMSAAFGRWLEGLLGPLGLVVYDSSD
jgi:uncharacterized protein YllA (UPF0747 family)